LKPSVRISANIHLIYIHITNQANQIINMKLNVYLKNLVHLIHPSWSNRLIPICW